MEQLGKILIFIGAVLVVAGIIIYFAGDKLNLFNLPGDIRIVRGNVRIYFPITTMIILSIILSLIIYLIRKLF